MSKKPLAQACKEAKGPIEFSQRAINEAARINELATLLQGDENSRTIAAALYLGLADLAGAADHQDGVRVVLSGAVGVES
jgi:hypothetical protein